MPLNMAVLQISLVPLLDHSFLSWYTNEQKQQKGQKQKQYQNRKLTVRNKNKKDKTKVQMNKIQSTAIF